jgi:hypothetical protein
VSIDALATAGAPGYLLAVLDALQFKNPSTSRLQELADADWKKLLAWCDARQLTLMLPHLCGDAIPASVQQRINGNRDTYAERFGRLRKEIIEICDELDRVGLEFALLKGLSHSPAFTPDPLMRAQGDIDLWLRGESVYEAQKRLTAMGYAPLWPAKLRHLTSMARPIEWRWRGDPFASDLPVSVELHYELWSERTDYISIPGQEGFWLRRKHRSFEECSISVLCDQDLFGFAALHAFWHLLEGDPPIQRIWELGNFLHQRAHDEEFWNSWRDVHPRELRQIEALMSGLVSTWFGCDLPDVVLKEIANLPENVCLWMKTFSLSPLIGQFRPNKDELWLHLALIPRFDAKMKVFLRRVFPMHVPLSMSGSGNESAGRMRQTVRVSGLVVSKFAYHARTLLPTVAQGLRWVWLR